MLLKIFPAFRPRLSPFVWTSRISASHRVHYSILHKLSSSRMFKRAFSHFHLALPHNRKPQECCCRLTEAYYQEMLKASPENPVLLKNYAKFLHEVKGNITKADELYRRAILADPADGELLSLYAQLIWELHKDLDRAQAYFDQAIEASPHDCYVMASYANFLWNWEESDGDIRENLPTNAAI